jgi:hypothetical protein
MFKRTEIYCFIITKRPSGRFLFMTPLKDNITFLLNDVGNGKRGGLQLKNMLKNVDGIR